MTSLRCAAVLERIRLVPLLMSLATLSACGGSGGSPPPTPQPVVMLTANPTSVTAGQTSTLTWSSTNATTCTASQGWSGTKATSGSEQVGPLTATTTFTLSCTGNGGTAAQSAIVSVTASPPVVTITANPTSIAAGQTSTLTWSSTNATTCTASQGWSGTKATSGSEQVGPLTATTTFTLSCTGSGGTTTESTAVTVTPTSGGVVVSGRITFDRIAFNAAGTGLNPTAPIEAPARLVVVEALDANSSAVLATTATDADGNYAVAVPANRNISIRAKAQMVKADGAPIWNFSVLSNTNGNALYVLDGSAFDSGTANSTRNLRATSGWGTNSYTGTRAAAPFAILDTVFTARALILSAVANTAFPALNLYWSPTNRATSGAFCTTTGDIGTTFFTSGGQNAGNCTQNGALAAGIYILGDFANGNGDTDEFDQHVIAHEFGHYIENNFSRSDSIGGEHGATDRVDLRVAFGEGWGNAYSGMALNDPLYRDSFAGVSQESRFNLETDNQAVEGWFGEFSVQEILWDLFDNVADGADQISLGFTPIYSVMTGGQRTTDALTSIFSFADALRSANPTQVSAINSLLGGESISVSDAFGDNESNAGGSATSLPIYQDIASGQQLSVCGSGADDSRNKLGYRRFLRLQLASPAVLTITVTGAVGPGVPAGSIAATDPDIFVYRRGTLEQFSNQTGQTDTISQKPFEAGLHIIEVYDFDFTVPNANLPHCMTVSVTG